MTIESAGPTKTQLRRAYFDCIALGLRKTARLVSARYDEALRGTGLRSTQFQILATVALVPGVNITELAESIDADRTTVQRSLTRLIEQGWLLSESGDGGNVRRLTLTEAGSRKLAEAYSLWEEAQSEVAAALGADRARNLLRDLRMTRRRARHGWPAANQPPQRSPAPQPPERDGGRGK